MTGLCQLPNCRQRNRHLPACQDGDCTGCLPRLATEGLCCDVCVGRAAARLEAIIELTPDARLVAAGLVRRGGGHASGKPQSRPPLNDGATDVLDAVQSALTTLARDIAETRGITIQGDREDAPSGRPRAPRSAEMGSGIARVGVDAQGLPEARTDNEERAAQR